MNKVMICGVRRKEEIDLLVRCGTDAIGFITEVRQNIDCNLSRKEAANFVRAVPPFIISVLILTEESTDEIIKIAEEVKPDLLQLHGFNSPVQVSEIKQRLGIKIIKTLHFNGDVMAEPGDPVKTALEYTVSGADAVMMDSYQADKVGATGEKVAWGLARMIRDAIYPVPLVLAGGLNKGNITEAITCVRPFAIDALSGLVTGGYLDELKIYQFMNLVSSVQE